MFAALYTQVNLDFKISISQLDHGQVDPRTDSKRLSALERQKCKIELRQCWMSLKIDISVGNSIGQEGVCTSNIWPRLPARHVTQSMID